MSTFIQREEKNGVVYLRLNRPEKLNPLGNEMFTALAKHIDDIGARQTVGCVVLQANGKHFSAGHDLGELKNELNLNQEAFYSGTIRKMELLPIPVIAAVQGHCITGGMELMLGADIIVASDNAHFVDLHAKYGLVPLWGMSQRLPKRIGVGAAKLLMFSSRRIDARQAREIGLVDETYPQADFNDMTQALAEEIAACSAHTHGALKRIFHDTDSLAMDASLEREVLGTEGFSDDAPQRMAAVLIKTQTH